MGNADREYPCGTSFPIHSTEPPMILRIDRLLVELPAPKNPSPNDEANKIWNGPHPEDGKELMFEHLPKDFGAPVPDLPAEPQLNAPLDPDTIADLMKKMK